MKNVKIAVIMTVHNRREQTLNCIKRLFEECSSLDIYLTDDGCTDGTVDAVKNEFPDVKVIEGNGNLYWNRGMYVAFQKASQYDYDYYLWINDDTVVCRTFLENLLACSESENDRSIICGATLETKDSSVITYGGYTKDIKSLPLSEGKQYCDFASGNIVLIPRFVYNRVGNLDYYYRHALGDFDYAGRARKLGLKIVQAPGVCGQCRRHSSIPKWRNTDYSLICRIQHLYSPLGRNPIEFIYYDYRHNGLMRTIIHFFTLHLRCFFPRLWGTNYNKKE